MKLKNKVMVITGASDGIGKEIALRLAKENVRLALLGRDAKKLKAVQEKALQLGAADAKSYAGDVRETKKMQQTVATILSDFQEVDVLINNAGIWQKVMPLENISPEVIDEVIAINLTAVIHMTQMLLPTLQSRPEAAILNVVSRSGITAQPGQSVYSASKYGVHGFTEVLKVDLKGSHVRVAGLYQGGTNTQLFEKTGEDFPVEKFTNPADLADVVASMLSLPEKIWLHDVRVEY